MAAPASATVVPAMQRSWVRLRLRVDDAAVDEPVEVVRQTLKLKLAQKEGLALLQEQEIPSRLVAAAPLRQIGNLSPRSLDGRLQQLAFLQQLCQRARDV